MVACAIQTTWSIVGQKRIVVGDKSGQEELKRKGSLQPTISKSGKKLELFVIFKGAPPPVDGSAPRHDTVADELYLQKVD